MKRKIISFVLTLLLSVSCVSGLSAITAKAAPDTPTGFYFDSDGGIITGYSGTATNLVIPSTINGVKVTGLDKYAFDSCTKLTSVTIPNGVTDIGLFAFKDCKSLTSVTISSTLTDINTFSFAYCTSLTGFNVDSTNPNYSSQDGILYDKNKSTLVEYPAGRTSTSFTIPSGVKSIGDGAFCGAAKLTSVNIPNSVTSIGGWSFQDCTALKGITIPGSVTYIDNQGFYGCTALNSVTLSNGLLGFGNGTFEDCTSLNSVTLPSSITYIGDNAFNKSVANFTIYGTVGSLAQSYARDNSIQFRDSSAPIIKISLYNTKPTNQNITVTVTTNKGKLNASSHTFTANGKFTFTAIDSKGKKCSLTVTITNIDKTATHNRS